MMKRFLLLFFILPLLFSGCKKDASDERIHDVLVGKWLVISSGCNGSSWREYKADGTFDEFDGCLLLLRPSAGTWRIENQWLIIKAKVFPIDVYYSFYYLSTTNMTIKRGKTDSDNPQVKYKKE